MFRSDTRSRRVRTATALALVVLLVLMLAGIAGCAKSSDTTPVKPSGSGSETTTETGGETTPTETEPQAETPVKAYFLTGEKLTPVAGTAEGKGVAAAAMELLLAGPGTSAAGLTSSIPAGTRLRGVSIADKVATVDLTTEFTSGGGTLSMTSRVAQIVYTLTQFSTVDAVRFEVEGETLDVLGGEGIMLDGPQSRADWEDFAPAVLIESPTWMATVNSSSALRVTGSANVFEAVFQLEIADSTGRIVRTERAQASSGTGTRGTFDASVPLTSVPVGKATLIASYLSAKDGSRVVVAEIPLTIE